MIPFLVSSYGPPPPTLRHRAYHVDPYHVDPYHDQRQKCNLADVGGVRRTVRMVTRTTPTPTALRLYSLRSNLAPFGTTSPTRRIVTPLIESECSETDEGAAVPPPHSFLEDVREPRDVSDRCTNSVGRRNNNFHRRTRYSFHRHPLKYSEVMMDHSGGVDVALLDTSIGGCLQKYEEDFSLSSSYHLRARYSPYNGCFHKDTSDVSGSHLRSQMAQKSVSDAEDYVLEDNDDDDDESCFFDEDSDSDDDEEYDTWSASLLSESYRVRPMTTRRASLSSYGGEGFEIYGKDSQLLQLLHRTECSDDEEDPIEEEDYEDQDQNEPELQDETHDDECRDNCVSENELQNVATVVQDPIDVSNSAKGLQQAQQQLQQPYHKNLLGRHHRFPLQDIRCDSPSNMDVSAYDDFDDSCSVVSSTPIGQPQNVLTTSMMENLQSHLPFGKRGEPFSLKYSMVRDGSSSQTFLQKVQGCKYTLLAMETVDGEVFGSFTSEPWHITHGTFGTSESFVWRKLGTTNTSNSTQQQQQTQQRRQSLTSASQQRPSWSSPQRRLQPQAPAQSPRQQGQYRRRSLTSISSSTVGGGGSYLEQVEVFHSSYLNRCMQLCKHNRIAVGGGAPSSSEPREICDYGGQSRRRRQKAKNVTIQPNQWGFALAFEGDSMLEATTSPCITYNSPSLSHVHPDGSLLELVNVEAWTVGAVY